MIRHLHDLCALESILNNKSELFVQTAETSFEYDQKTGNRSTEQSFSSSMKGALKLLKSDSKYKVVLNTQLLLLANGIDPKTSLAIALYAPQHHPVNRSPVLGLDKKEGKILYEEDRRTRSVIMFSHVIPTQIGIRSRFFLSGLLTPEHGNF